MGAMAKVWLIARHDLSISLREFVTILWLVIMPFLFFFFLGTINAQNQSALGDQAVPIAVERPANAGLLADELLAILEENQFVVSTLNGTAPDGAPPDRILRIPEHFTREVLAGNQVTIPFEGDRQAPAREYEELQVTVAAFKTLAGVVAVAANRPAGPAATAAELEALRVQQRTITVDIEPAGKRQTIPSGFEQAVPGTLVMFTLLVLLSSGASLLVIDRDRGVLRRLAYAPIGRGTIIAGKWAGKYALGIVQIGIALLMGTFIFGMDWGPDFPMILAIVLAWGAFCASAGLLLGSLAKTLGQAVGLGVLVSVALAALGGCWWPIEITPEWMQLVQKFTPTGWAINALHNLISFEAGASSALPHLGGLVAGALLLGWFATRSFR